MTKTEVLERLVRDLELRGRAPMTIKDYKGKIQRYQDYYGKPADQLAKVKSSSTCTIWQRRKK